MYYAVAKIRMFELWLQLVRFDIYLKLVHKNCLMREHIKFGFNKFCDFCKFPGENVISPAEKYNEFLFLKNALEKYPA